jgi:hypothetical protein
MARLARVVVPGHRHHVTQRAAEVSDGRRFPAAEEDEETPAILRHHGRTGRPWADARFLARLEKPRSRRHVPRRPGRPRKGP